MSHIQRTAVCLTLAVMLVGLGGCASYDSSEIDLQDNTHVTEWVDLTYSLVSLERQNPPRASRSYAYIMTALYEGWVHGIGDMQSLVGVLNGLDELPAPEDGREYDWPAVATTSAYEVAQHVLGPAPSVATLQALDTLKREQLENREANGISAAVLEHSSAHGKRLADALIAWIDEDGYQETRHLAYAPVEGPDRWVPTADYGISVTLDAATHVTHLFEESDAEEVNQAEMIMREWQSDKMLHLNRPNTFNNWTVAQEPHWGEIRPLVIDPDEHRVLPHKPFSPDETSLFYEELMEVYNISQELTDEHIQTVHFWIDAPGETGTPGGHWLKLGTQLAQEHELSLPETLQLAVLVSVATFDSHIACWQAKYEHSLVRPKTLINQWIDEHWDAPIPIPPHPEYPSGHATTSGAAALSLTAVFGEVAFIDKTHKHRYGFSERSYSSFAEAAQQAADSRLYAGLHFPMGNQNGLEQGERVGRTVTQELLARMHGEALDISERLPEPLFAPIYADQPLHGN